MIYVLFFISGAAALIYEVLWMRELGLLFGNTALAAATTLSAFFFGLAVGGYHWGRRIEEIPNPLRQYGILELLVTVTALGYFALIPLFREVYPLLFGQFSETEAVFLGIKFLLAMAVLFPPAYFIGGTLPVISQYLAQSKTRMGQKVSLLYGVNTLGAASGSLAAGFILPMALGYRYSYLLAMSMTLTIGAVSIVLSKRHPHQNEFNNRDRAQSSSTPIGSRSELTSNELLGLSFSSGFITLALQILWTRMFAQVLQNSVYTFSTIVVVFLIVIAVAAGLANRIIHYRFAPIYSLAVLSLMGALLTVAVPWGFMELTEGLNYFGVKSDWTTYLFQVFALAFLVMGPTLLCLGTVFPLLMKLSEWCEGSAGRLIGRLAAINTLGAAVGAPVAGFFMLDQFGLWKSLFILAAGYAVVALYLGVRMMGMAQSVSFRHAIVCASATVILMYSLVVKPDFPAVRVGASLSAANESVVEIWEGSSGTVSVIEQKDPVAPGKILVINNHYTLGAESSRDYEMLQGHLSLLLHPKPRSVFFLGMGTGNSAAAALLHPVTDVTVAELIGDVVTASRKYFQTGSNSLYTDNRVKIVTQDGRNYLSATERDYDVVVADLFLPWKAGTGNLYSHEHFETIRRRLHDDGIFMQWIPSYQITFDEFATVARTMLEVFPQVTLWRGDFLPNKGIIGLAGHRRAQPISQSIASTPVIRPEYGRRAIPLIAHYAGNIRRAAGLFKEYPINRDDWPIIEYNAPKVHKAALAQRTTYLTGASLIRFMVKLNQLGEREHDPYTERLDGIWPQVPLAGLYLQRKLVLEARNQQKAARSDFDKFFEIMRVATE